MADENGTPMEVPAEIKDLADKIVNLKVSEAVHRPPARTTRM